MCSHRVDAECSFEGSKDSCQDPGKKISCYFIIFLRITTYVFDKHTLFYTHTTCTSDIIVRLQVSLFPNFPIASLLWTIREAAIKKGFF